MKRILSRQPEPLLLIVPSLMAGINLLRTKDQSKTSLAAMHTALLFWYLFATVVVPLFLHFLLRKSNKWQAVPGKWQVYSTLFVTLLFCLLFFSEIGAQPVALQEQPGRLPLNALLQAGIYGWLLLVGFLIQLCFTGYFLFRIFQRD